MNNKNTDWSDVAWIVVFLVLIVLFAGDQSIHDSIVKMLGN